MPGLHLILKENQEGGGRGLPLPVRLGLKGVFAYTRSEKDSRKRKTSNV